MGGVGKTQCAVQYAHQQRNVCRHIFWTSAETESGFLDSVAVQAKLLECGTSAEGRKRTPSKDTLIRSFRYWLATNTAWLLIIDNADTEDSAVAIDRYLPSAHSGIVLITSRIADVWPPSFRTHKVYEWDAPQSAKFLRKRLTNPDAEEVELLALAGELSGLPLALEHAAAYINETRITVATYRKLFARQRVALFSRPYRGATNYTRSISTTWRLSIDRLSFLARYILRIGACFAPDPIPRHIVDHLVQRETPWFFPWHGLLELRRLGQARASSGSANTALSELSRYSLITLSEDSFRIHPLLQAVVRESAPLPFLDALLLQLSSIVFQINFGKTKRSALWAARAALLLGADGVLPECDIDGDLSWYYAKQLETYLPHVEAVLHYLPEKRFGDFIPRIRLESVLREHQRVAAEYAAGVAAIVRHLGLDVDSRPELREEASWFLSRLDDLVEKAVSLNNCAQDYSRRSVVDEVASIAKLPEEIQLFWTYQLVFSIAQEIAQRDDVATASRLFRFGVTHASENKAASWQDRASGLLQQPWVLNGKIPREDVLLSLEKGLSMCEEHGLFANGDALRGVGLYASLIDRDADANNARRWLSQALPFAREIMDAGFPYGIWLSWHLALMLEASDNTDEALSVCSATLRRAIRPRRYRLFNYSRVKRELKAQASVLWEIRGRLLGRAGRYRTAARSYARCLDVEQQRGESSPWRVLELLENCIVMYLNAGDLEPANLRLTEAWSMLAGLSEQDRDSTERHCFLLGVLFVRAKRVSEGEALIRRAVDSASRRRCGEDPWFALVSAALAALPGGGESHGGGEEPDTMGSQGHDRS